MSGRTADLPKANHLLERLRPSQTVAFQNPSWRVYSTPEVAHDLLLIHNGSLFNWTQRRIAPPVEPTNLYRKVGRRNLYRLDKLCRWLDQRHGEPERPLWSWSYDTKSG